MTSEQLKEVLSRHGVSVRAPHPGSVRTFQRMSTKVTYDGDNGTEGPDNFSAHGITEDMIYIVLDPFVFSEYDDPNNWGKAAAAIRDKMAHYASRLDEANMALLEIRRYATERLQGDQQELSELMAQDSHTEEDKAFIADLQARMKNWLNCL
jgi:hypothetical protein